MIGPSKPLYQFQRKLTYQRHLERLHQIGKERSKRVLDNDTILQMHRIRKSSANFRTQLQADKLNHQNQKIITSILQIARRKSTPSVQQPIIRRFYNPARKRQQREIQISNMSLAERILTKHSQFDPATQRKNIELYEEVKRRMEHNKKVSLPQLETLHRVSSVGRIRAKSPVRGKSPMRQNPETIQ